MSTVEPDPLPDARRRIGTPAVAALLAAARRQVSDELDLLLWEWAPAPGTSTARGDKPESDEPVLEADFEIRDPSEIERLTGSATQAVFPMLSLRLESEGEQRRLLLELGRFPRGQAPRGVTLALAAPEDSSSDSGRAEESVTLRRDQDEWTPALRAERLVPFSTLRGLPQPKITDVFN